MYYCLKCQTNQLPKINYFSYSLGGIICENCHKHDINSQPISINAIKLLRLLLSLENISSIKNIDYEIRELKTILNNFTEYISERKIKSAKYLL
jgi:recombinational DNA repair protein (RecF pathway)